MGASTNRQLQRLFNAPSPATPSTPFNVLTGAETFKGGISHQIANGDPSTPFRLRRNFAQGDGLTGTRLNPPALIWSNQVEQSLSSGAREL